MHYRCTTDAPPGSAIPQLRHPGRLGRAAVARKAAFRTTIALLPNYRPGEQNPSLGPPRATPAPVTYEPLPRVEISLESAYL